MKMSNIDWIQAGMFIAIGIGLTIGVQHGSKYLFAKKSETAEKKSEDKEEPAKEPEKKAIT